MWSGLFVIQKSITEKIAWFCTTYTFLI